MEGSAWLMRDLRSEMYASGINDDDNNVLGKTKGMEIENITREEFNRKIKELERKIALLESKIQNLTMVY